MIKYHNGVEVHLTDTEIAEYNALQAASALEKTERVLQEARADRDSRLTKEVDPIVSNPLRWASLSSETQAAWSAYRQALLDVPQQSGFPTSVTWPTKP